MLYVKNGCTAFLNLSTELFQLGFFLPCPSLFTGNVKASLRRAVFERRLVREKAQKP